MKVRRLLSLLLAVAIAASMLLAGCGSQAGEAKPKIEGPQKVRINIAAEPPQMNTITTSDTTSFTVIRHVFEGLVTLDKDNRPAPGIATKWDISKDGLTYTFELRKNAKWSDGTPVTANDFVFAMRELVNAANAAPYASMGFLIKNGEKVFNGEMKPEELGVKAEGDNKLVVTLEIPTAYFLDLMAFGIFMPVNEAFYKKTVDGDKVTYGTEADKMIYNGPYMIKEWAHEDKIILVRNPNYYDPKKTYLDEISMAMINDSNAAYNMYAGDELDMVGLAGDLLNKAKNDGYDVYQYSDGSSWYLEFNHKDKLMGNVNIRKALTMALDRESFVKNVVKNDSLPALSFTSPDIKGEKDYFKKEVGDLFKDKQYDEAKKLFAKGLEEAGISGTPKIEFLSGDSDVAKKQATAMQEFWRKNLGIEVEIVTVPFKTRLQRMQDGQFQMVYAGWGPDYNDPMTFVDLWESTNTNNHGKYTSADYDKLIQDARKETDTKKRFELLKSAEKKIVDDMIVGPIYFRMVPYSTKPAFKGVVRNAFQDINLLWAYMDNSAK